MDINVYPTTIEAVNKKYGYTVFTLEAFDEAAATLKVDCCINASDWDDISKAIKEALIMMKLTGDKVEE